MSNYIIGADIINGNENTYKEKVASAVRNKNHNAEILATGPNNVQSYGQKASANGKIGVYIVGGFGLGTPTDMATGIGKYYHYTHIFFLGSYEFTHNQYLRTSSMDMPANRCEPGMSAVQCNMYRGMTPNQWNKKFTNGTVIYRDTLQECIDVMLNGSSSSNTDEGSSSSTYKDVLKELLSHWDGEAELRVINDTVYVNKIPDPKTSKILINEDVIYHNGVTVNDVNPDLTNKLIVHSTVCEDIILVDDKLIERFGEHKEEVNAVKYDAHKETETVPKDSTDSTDSSTETKTRTVTEEIPCATKEEVEAFASTYWNKIKRDDGFSIELNLEPSSEYKIGEWVHVSIKKYGVDDYCYITKISNNLNSSDVWSTNLTLTHYPPSFGTEEDFKKDTTDSDSDSSDSSTE